MKFSIILAALAATLAVAAPVAVPEPKAEPEPEPKNFGIATWFQRGCHRRGQPCD